MMAYTRQDSKTSRKTEIDYFNEIKQKYGVGNYII